jgi:vitamin B12 transport system permease protein
MKVRNVFSLSFAVVSTLMLGLAAGAVWMVPTLYSQHPLPWLAVPVGWLLGKAIRHWVRPAGSQAAVLAALATFTAVLYVNVLMAAARIAGLMGLGLVDAIRTAGLRLLVQLAELGCTPTDDVWFLAGMGLSAFVAMRYGRQPPAG